MSVMQMFIRLCLMVMMGGMMMPASLAMAQDNGAGAELGADIIMPSPEFSPEDVVEIQLLGLKLTKGDSGSVEMRQVWAFAHPMNKRMTGPLARFARLFDLPAYRPLLGHKSHEILRLSDAGDDQLVQLRVQVTGADGRGYVYLWVVGRVNGGVAAGSWMTVSVSAPAGGGTSS